MCGTSVVTNKKPENSFSALTKECLEEVCYEPNLS